jgi:hypothetical protein
MDNADKREEFLNSVRVLTIHNDDGYVVACEGNQYEIAKVTPERPNADGSVNPGAVLIEIDGGEARWIPKSVLAVDSDETLYVLGWYYERYF